MVDVEIAAFHLVHDFKGGAPALGPLAGIDATLLSNKVNPNNDRNHLMLKEAVRIQMASGDHRVLHAMAENLGEVCLPLPEVKDGDLLKDTLRSTRAVGEMMREIDVSLADDVVTANELRRIQHATLDAVAHLAALYARIANKAGQR